MKLLSVMASGLIINAVAGAKVTRGNLKLRGSYNVFAKVRRNQIARADCIYAVRMGIVGSDASLRRVRGILCDNQARGWHSEGTQELTTFPLTSLTDLFLPPPLITDINSQSSSTSAARSILTERNGLSSTLSEPLNDIPGETTFRLPKSGRLDNVENWVNIEHRSFQAQRLVKAGFVEIDQSLMHENRMLDNWFGQRANAIEDLALDRSDEVYASQYIRQYSEEETQSLVRRSPPSRGRSTSPRLNPYQNQDKRRSKSEDPKNYGTVQHSNQQRRVVSPAKATMIVNGHSDVTVEGSRLLNQYSVRQPLRYTGFHLEDPEEARINATVLQHSLSDARGSVVSAIASGDSALAVVDTIAGGHAFIQTYPSVGHPTVDAIPPHTRHQFRIANTHKPGHPVAVSAQVSGPGNIDVSAIN